MESADRLVSFYVIVFFIFLVANLSSGAKVTDEGTYLLMTKSLAVDGENIYISYYDAANYDLKFARSADGGRTWESSLVEDGGVDGGGIAVKVGMYNSVAFNRVDEGNATLCISYFNERSYNLKAAVSTDGGDTWNIMTVDGISPYAGSVGFYSSVASGGPNRFYISHYDKGSTKTNPRFALSASGGAAWTVGEIESSADDFGWYTSIAAVEGLVADTIYAAYYNKTTLALRFARSAGGGVWETKDIDGTAYPEYGGRTYPSLAVEGENVFVSYSQYYGGSPVPMKKLRFATSPDKGDTWDLHVVDDDLEIDFTYHFEGIPNALASAGGSLYIAYYDRINGSLKFARSTDGGATWPETNFRLIDTVGYFAPTDYPGVHNVAMAAEGSRVYVTYYDADNGSLKFARSADGGNTWEP